MVTEFSLNGQEHKMISCGGCGVLHSMPKSLYLKHYNEGEATGGWRCPNGCSRVFREGEVDRIRRERDRLKQERAMLSDGIREHSEEAAAAKRSAAAYKGAATRMKNRAKAGVCPCCNRHFANLERHMKSQHSEADLSNVVEIGQHA